MTARIINGNEIAGQIIEEMKQRVADMKNLHGVTPGLATVMLGNNPASLSYVASKVKMCQNLGIYSERHDLPDSTTQAELLSLLDNLNQNKNIHGILVQLPLPEHISEEITFTHISPYKDVDGLHPMNLGKMMIGSEDYLPCTPYGIRMLLSYSGVNTDGAHVVIIGRSNIVGKPLANMLIQKNPRSNATVTVCHTHTRNLADHTRTADILIVASGRPKSITADMVKEGAVIIDVGIHRIGKTPSGKNMICGDVDFDSVKEKAGAITPVPGGIGPMTIAMLMVNTIKAASLASGLEKPEEIKYGLPT